MLSLERIFHQMDVYATKIKQETSHLVGLECRRHEEPMDHTAHAFEHMWYMCCYIREMIADTGEEPCTVSQRDKIMRWHGWLQAKLNTHGFYSLSELKSHNAPVGQEFRADGDTPTST
jgi:hypothetical protein